MTDNDERRQLLERQIGKLDQKIEFLFDRIQSHHDSIAIYEDQLSDLFEEVRILRGEISELP